jgi:hypothetical protein
MAHACGNRLYPGEPIHSPKHAYLERDMIKYVIEHGWLDGKLVVAPKPKPVKSKPGDAEKLARADAAVKRWTTKFKRAETGLKKALRRQKYYQNRLAKGA